MTYNTLKAAFEHAALAQAAYMDLPANLAGNNLKTALQANGMTEFMADYLSKRYEVVDSAINSNLLGYQGIIFQEKGTQNYVLVNVGWAFCPAY